jgi:hypothetical protein
MGGDLKARKGRLESRKKEEYGPIKVSLIHVQVPRFWRASLIRETPRN